jgi:hypothetical protein
MDRPWAAANQQRWNERVPVHAASSFYDVDAFKGGPILPGTFRGRELGALGEMRLVHLQCHIGLDTLDLARLRPGLIAAWLDFSSPAVELATELADELGLGSWASFVHADVHHAVTRSKGWARLSTNVVYMGKGALVWLPDLDAWASQCASLLRPGGGQVTSVL